ncbi:MAG: LPS export ABC transporter ATP-binding protein [Gammaproteobacteria bacterium]|nr:LPS export ABC transporter ATP-binding protein [Gammaproteobacteria bacterium]
MASEANEPAARLTVTGLTKRYRGRNVVEGVGLAVDSGEVVGLLGPNGAGKTTSFYMILGLVKADAGSIRIDDQNLSRAPMHQRARAGIGYLPQEASVFRKLNVEQNILAVAELRRDLDRDSRRALVAELLRDLRLTDIRDNLGERLSGGERRRVEIARALAGEPRFMLLDEPFAGVDPISVDNLKQEIRALAGRNIGVLITDHNVRETLDICDRAYIVNEGHLIAEGKPDAILSNETVRRVYLGEMFEL